MIDSGSIDALEGINIRNAAGAIVNPATEDTLSSINTKLGGTGTVSVVSGTVSISSAVISGTVTVSQGTVSISSISHLGHGTVTIDNASFPISGTVTVSQGTANVIQSGTWNVGLSTGSNVIGTTTINDGGGSITVDGTFFQTIQPISGTVTVQQGTAAVTQSGTWNIGTVTSLTQLNGANISMNSGTRDAGTQRVTIATNDIVPASQSGTWNVGLSAGSNNVGTVTVSQIVSALPTGSNAIGKLAANSGVDIGDVDVLSLPALAAGGNTIGTAFSVGNVAHDSVSSGNPVRIGRKAETSPKGITTVADGDVTESYADADGIAMMKPFTSYADIVVERVAVNNATATNFTNFSAVASTRNYITSISVWNSSANNTYVDILDRTGGTILYTIPAPTVGGAIPSLPLPIRQSTAGSALAYQVNTASSTVYISVIGFQSKL